MWELPEGEHYPVLLQRTLSLDRESLSAPGFGLELVKFRVCDLIFSGQDINTD